MVARRPRFICVVFMVRAIWQEVQCSLDTLVCLVAFLRGLDLILYVFWTRTLVASNAVWWCDRMWQWEIICLINEAAVRLAMLWENSEAGLTWVSVWHFLISQSLWPRNSTASIFDAILEFSACWDLVDYIHIRCWCLTQLSTLCDDSVSIDGRLQELIMERTGTHSRVGERSHDRYQAHNLTKSQNGNTPRVCLSFSCMMFFSSLDSLTRCSLWNHHSTWNWRVGRWVHVIYF